MISDDLKQLAQQKAADYQRQLATAEEQAWRGLESEATSALQEKLKAEIGAEILHGLSIGESIILERSDSESAYAIGDRQSHRWVQPCIKLEVEGLETVDGKPVTAFLIYAKLNNNYRQPRVGCLVLVGANVEGAIQHLTQDSIFPDFGTWLVAYLGGWPKAVMERRKQREAKAACAREMAAKAKAEQVARDAERVAKEALAHELENKVLAIESSVLAAVENQVERLSIFPLSAVLFYWRWCIAGGVTDSGELWAEYDEGFSLNSQLTDEGWLYLNDQERDVKLDKQVHKPIVEEVFLSDLNGAIAWERNHNCFQKLTGNLGLTVKGAKYEGLRHSDRFLSERDFLLWGDKGQSTYSATLPRKWLRSLVGLPEELVIEIEPSPEQAQAMAQFRVQYAD